MAALSEKAKKLFQSGIRAATAECNAMGGVNLGQGVCELPVVATLKQAAQQAIDSDKSVYTACEGVLELRQAIANKVQRFNKIPVSVDEVMVSHGSTGAFVCASVTLFNAGDEVILFEPFYGYHKKIFELHDIQVKLVPIHIDDLSIDMDQLKRAITKKTRAIVICTPNNPTGKIYSKEELIAIGRLAEQHDLYIITDEIYEYIVYPGYQHISIASLENFKERTITISGFSKTYNMTGWRLGYAVGPAEIISKMALVQDYMYICPAAPLQYAAIAAFQIEQQYYDQMVQNYLMKRDLVIDTLRHVGFKYSTPQGAYYILINFSELGFNDDLQAASYLLKHAKVATVTGRSFYANPLDGQHILRVCYALEEDKISLAMSYLKTANYPSSVVKNV